MKSTSQKIIFGNFARAKPPVKPTNDASGRPREYLNRDEFSKLRMTLKKGNNAERNELLLLLLGQHALRVSELIALRWVDINVKAKTLSVHRLKSGVNGEHPLYRDEVRLISKLKRKQQPCDQDFIFKGYNQSAMTANAVYKLIQKAGIDAKIPFEDLCNLFILNTKDVSPFSASILLAFLAIQRCAKNISDKEWK